MQTLKGSTRHRSSSESTARGSTSGTSSSAGASMGTPPRRATNSARCVPARVSSIATTFDFIRNAFNHTVAMSTSSLSEYSPWPRALTALLSAVFFFASAPVFCAPSPLSSDSEGVRQEFMAAMQRVRLHQPDIPDSPALESYAIHDYLVAARLRRDVSPPDENIDATIDAFLHAHTGQPVTRGLRRDWLTSLAQRRRWDWF